MSLLSYYEYTAMLQEDAEKYEEDVVQPLYDNLYSKIKNGHASYNDKCLFLSAAEQYQITMNLAEEEFFYRRLNQLQKEYVGQEQEYPDIHQLFKRIASLLPC